MQRLPDRSLVIGVAACAAERVRLVRLLGGADVLLLVSDVDQARAFLALAGCTAPALVVESPGRTAAVPVGHVDAERPAEPSPPAAAVIRHPGGLELHVDRRILRGRTARSP
jgi:hypothetical protein